MAHNFHMIRSDDSPYDQRLFKANKGDGPINYSGMLVVSDMVPGNETKPLGTKTFAADQSLGKLAVPNPVFHGGAINEAAFYGNGFGWHQDAHYRNRARQIRDDLTNHTTNVRFDGRYHTRTPIPLPNVLPLDFFNDPN